MNADFQLLSGRTFHPDEANQAFTAGRLLETGRYEYRPDDHHGPTLYYAAAALQKAAGRNDLATMDGTLLRCTPLLFAALALVFAFISIRKLARGSLRAPYDWLVPAMGALLLGTSPIFVFFATDFIQEMLLACFTMMMLWAGVGYFKVPGASCFVPGAKLKHKDGRESNAPSAKIKPGTWALFFGIAAGLAFATKETSIISFIAAAIAGWCAWPRCVRPEGPHTQDDCQVVPENGSFVSVAPQAQAPAAPSHAANGKPLAHVPAAPSHAANGKQLARNRPESTALQAVLPQAVLLAGLAFLLTSILLFSSFASNWQGVYNAFIAAPLSYLGRAAGSAASAGAADHVHPWWQYLKWLFFPGWQFSALPLAALFLATFRRRSFIHWYALIVFALYSIIPYKTPWCALQLLAPLAVAPFAVPWTRIRAFIAFPLVALSLAANAIGCASIARDPDSKAIPYNYASASPEVKQLAAIVAAAMDAAMNHEPQATNHAPPFIAVALPPVDTWPFPWYNREFEPKTGYWTSFDDLKRLADGGIKPTVVIVPMAEGHLVQPLFPHLKNTKRFYMRPGVRVRVFW